MAVELFDNEFITTLTADITGTQPTIPVTAAASAALQAAGGQFRIIVDAERMLVTAGANSTTWTVTRGIENTGAVPHTANTMVAHILTVGGFLNHHTIHEPGGADPFTLLDDTNFNSTVKDGIATRPSLRTLGSGAQQAASGTDARLSDARNPLAHAPSHRYTGSDPLYELVPTSKSADYAAVVGDLVLMSGAHTVTLPTAPANSTQVGVIALSGQTTIARGGSSDTINVAGVANQTSFSIQTGTSAILYYFNGSWYALQSAGSGGGGGGGGTSLSPVSASADTLASANQLVLMTGAHTITLPTAPPPGTQVGVYALTAACSIARTGTDVIEFAGATPANTLVVPSGTEYVLEYYNGVWYGSGALSGSLTPPARAIMSANQTGFANGVWSKVNLDTRVYDSSGIFDTTNHRFVCPVAGYYHVDAMITSNSGAIAFVAGIYKNGGLYTEGEYTSAANNNVISDTIQCNAGDYIELYCYNGSGVAMNVAGINSYYTYMTVAQVGQLGAPPAGQGIATTARAYRNAALTLTASAWTKVPIDTASFDPGSNMDVATNHRYVCPVTGYYEVNTGVSLSATAGNATTLCAAIYKNGSVYTEGTFSYGNAAGGQTLAATANDVLYCQAGDYIEMYAWANVALGIVAGPTYTYLSVTQTAGANTVGALSPTAQNTAYAAGPGQLVLMTGANAVTLPSAPQAGTQVQVTALTASVPVNRGGADTINNMGVAGMSSLTVNSGQSTIFSYLGGAWYASPTGGGTNLAPPARVSGSTIANLTAGSWTKIPFNTKTFDPGGNFDVTSTYRYIVPVGGVYEVNAMVTSTATAAGQTMNCAVYKNGAVVTQGPQLESNIAGTIGANVADFVQCNAGDYLEVFAFSGAALAIGGGSNQTYFSVGQVGTTGAPSPGQGQATAVRAYRNAAFTTTASASQKVPLDTKSYDPGNNFDAATNHRYICPATGYYQVNAEWHSATGASDTLIAMIYKNGAEVSRGNRIVDSNTQAAVVVTDLVQCNAGDYLEFWIFTTDADGANVGANTCYMSVFQAAGTNLVGALSPTAQTADYAAGAGQLVMMTGQHTVTLPNAPMAGSQVGINALTNTVTIARSGTDTINLNGTAGQTSVTVPQGTITILTYLNGAWYAAAPPTGTVAPPARAHMNAATSAVGAGWTKVPMDTKDFDPGGNFDVTTNHQYVCPTAGLYAVDGQVALTATAAGQACTAAIAKNNSMAGGNGSLVGDQIYSAGAGETICASVTGIVQCAAGDSLSLYAAQSAGAQTANGGADYQTRLAIHQISQTGAPQTPAGQGIATQAKAYRSAGFTIPAAAWTKLPLDTVSYDPGGNFVIGSSRYVVPATGYYLIDAQLTLAAGANSQSLVSIYRNGIETARGNSVAAASGQQTFTASDILSLVAGDYIEVYCYSTNGQAIAGGSAVTDYLSVVQVAGANLVAALSPTAQTADYTAGIGQLVLMTGQHTVTLPNAPQAGTQVGVNALTNTVAVARQGADTINFNGTSGQTSINVPQGATTILTYLNGAWYGAGPTQTTLTLPARAYRNAAWSIPNNAITKVPYDTKSYDPSGNFDVTTNNRFICPSAGYYHISASLEVSIQEAVERMYLSVYKNGAESGRGMDTTYRGMTAGDNVALTISDTVQCNAGDYLEIFVFAGPSVNPTIQVGGSFLNYVSVMQVAQTGAPQLPPGQGIATAARAYRNAALTTVANAWTKIPLDTVSAGNDPGGNFSLANGRYTCPTTGSYQVDASVGVNATAAGQRMYVGVYKNGTLVSASESDSGGGSPLTPSATVADVIQCSAGDYLELWYYCNVAGLGLNAGTSYTVFLSVVQVGGTNLVGALSPTAQTADYTAGPGQSTLMTGQHNYTLPNAPQNGTEEEVAALTGHVKVLRQGTDTITYGDTGLTQIWVPQGTVFRLRYLNGVWYVVDNPIGATDHLQNGVVNAGDLAVTAVSVASGTGAITFTVASGIAWVRTNNGILVRVPVIGQSFTISPASLPAAGQYAVIGMELAQSGNVLLSAKGTDTATNLNTAALVASNSPAVTGGRMRIWDAAIGNAAGVYSLVGQLDRRPWARGAHFRNAWSGTQSLSTTNNGLNNLAARLECSGVPMKVVAVVGGYSSGSGLGLSINTLLDGSLSGPTGYIDIPSSGFASEAVISTEFTPSAGSHLFQIIGAAYNSGTVTVVNGELRLEEVLRQNANNGVS